MTLNENHRRAILAAFRTIDRLLEDVENARASAASPFSRLFNDLTPTQQQVIGDYVAAIRARMTDALNALATSVKPPETAASWAIQTALAFAQITVQEIPDGGTRQGPGRAPRAPRSGTRRSRPSAQTRTDHP